MKKKLNSEISYFDIKLEENVKHLPCVIKILIENAIRTSQESSTIRALCNYKKHIGNLPINYYPSRVLMQDFTGVPAVVDLAALRDAVLIAGGNPKCVNPKVPVDLVIDHSIQVDSYGKESSADDNKKIEFKRNIERYKLLKWAQKSFENFRVVPPGVGICHQVNLEYLSSVVCTKRQNGEAIAYIDTLVGTDSHTTMSGGLSTLGWGVGGIEAESVMLGEPISMVIPEVIGLKLEGKLRAGVTSTDLILHITHLLREHKVVGKLVEVFGNGVRELSVADRATIANMAPECGSTCNFFAPDQKTLDYLDLTGKSVEQIKLVEDYAKTQTMWADYSYTADFVDIIHLNLGDVRTILAGPKRPQDKLLLHSVPENFRELYKIPLKDDDGTPSYATSIQTSTDAEQNSPNTQRMHTPIHNSKGLTHGSVVIAAITSCTNTSNPSAMIAAGLLAKKAVKLGLKTKHWVKTSLAPGSQVVSEYLKQAELQKYLDQLGFYVVGFGCTTCIGNSGEFPQEISKEIDKKNLSVVSVLSGNRNFEGRIHSKVKANYLASPMLVVAYAIAGNIMNNLESEPLGHSDTGMPIYLSDVLPSNDEIKNYIDNFVKKKLFISNYQNIFLGDKNWQKIECNASLTYPWDRNSTYIKKPPFLEENDQETYLNKAPHSSKIASSFTSTNEKIFLSNDQHSVIKKSVSGDSEVKSGDPQVAGKENIPKVESTLIENGRILAIFGDSITTDHISPAGTIPNNSLAGEHLKTLGIEPKDFNSYGSRRGNHEVMMRGTFGNLRIRNKMLREREGGYTIHYSESGKEELLSIYEAAMSYKDSKTDLVVFAGKEYGTGSSRDWAAKGTYLLGIKAVIAESFERIHRNNLVGMGVLPLVYTNPHEYTQLRLTGNEIVTIRPKASFSQMCKMDCTILNRNGVKQTLELVLLVNTEKEMSYIKVGNILKYVLKESFLI